MRTLLYRTLVASTILCQSMALVCACSTAASAQNAPAPQAQPGGADQNGDVEQMALTDKQIQNLLAAHQAINAILEKIPEDQADNPSPQVQAALDKTAKQNGFKDYGEYDEVSNNIEFILAGFDPEKKSFIGHEAVLKKQIAEISADSKMQPKEKQAQIKELKDMLKSITPVKFPDNVTLVTKYYDKLSQIFSEDK